MTSASGQLTTTHVGSLPRSDKLLEMLVQRETGGSLDERAFRDQVVKEMTYVLERQHESGIDLVNDGELPRIGFNIYVKDRMSGFGGQTVRRAFSDFAKFPGYKAMRVGPAASTRLEKALALRSAAPAAVGAIAYDPEMRYGREELALFDEALQRVAGKATPMGTFVSAASPGNVTTALSLDSGNPAYATEQEYIFGVADALRDEYALIVSKGHILQIDAPDLAMERTIKFQDAPLSDFLRRCEVQVEAINRAIAGLPVDKLRLHVCWGNWDGPHIDDVALADVLPIIYQAKVGSIGIPCANPRHQHEWKQFREMPLPDNVALMAGVIDTTTNYVEHPEVVADRLCQFAQVVDPRRLIACTDCGFSSFAGYNMVAEDVVWAKLSTLSKGAELASRRLFP